MKRIPMKGGDEHDGLSKKSRNLGKNDFSVEKNWENNLKNAIKIQSQGQF